jgi:hypothetical protein
VLSRRRRDSVAFSGGYDRYAVFIPRLPQVSRDGSDKKGQRADQIGRAGDDVLCVVDSVPYLLGRWSVRRQARVLQLVAAAAKITEGPARMNGQLLRWWSRACCDGRPAWVG